MPLLYGEGARAFVRLQEILKRSNDHSLFTWTAPKPEGITKAKPLLGGFLASSPDYFQHSNRYVSHNSPTQMLRLTQPYSMTNMGLCIDVPLFQVPGNCFIAVLLCGSTNARNSFTGLRVFVQNLGRFHKRGFLSGTRSFSEPGIAECDVYLDPIPLKVTETGFDNSVPWVKSIGTHATAR